MNHESLNRDNRHVADVHRIRTQFESMSADEVDILIYDKVQTVSARWDLCRKSFQMLFMALNRDNGLNLPQDNFDIRVGHEMIGELPFDTYVRVCRERKTGSFLIRPFTRSNRIESHEYAGERFDDRYVYRHGTHYSKQAVLSIDHDAPEPLLRLERVEGRVVTGMDTAAQAILVAGIDSLVDPLIEQIEESLIFITECAMNPELNPEHAPKFRLEHEQN